MIVYHPSSIDTVKPGQMGYVECRLVDGNGFPITYLCRFRIAVEVVQVFPDHKKVEVCSWTDQTTLTIPVELFLQKEYA